MRLLIYLLLAIPIALLWTLITNDPSVDSLIVGYVLGLAVVFVVRPTYVHIRWRRLPAQLFSLTVYIAILFRDIVRSGVDVAIRVLRPRMNLRPGILAVPTQDRPPREIVAALTADVITLTPGELVVEIEETHTLYVHCLDVVASEQTIHTTQARRLTLLKQIMGDDADE